MVLRRNPVTVRRNILPLADLNAQGIPDEFFQIPSDITLALALLYGIGPDAPHLLQTDANGNLKVVSPAGAGTVLYDSTGNILSTGSAVQSGANPLAVRLFDNTGLAAVWQSSSLTINKRPTNWTTRFTAVGPTTQTVSGASAGFNAGTYQDLVYFLAVTAASGTSPTLNCFIDVSPDGGVTWYQGPQIGPANIAAAPAMPAPGYTLVSSQAINGDYEVIRLRWVITGTTPSFTLALYGLGKPS